MVGTKHGKQKDQRQQKVHKRPIVATYGDGDDVKYIIGDVNQEILTRSRNICIGRNFKSGKNKNPERKLIQQGKHTKLEPLILQIYEKNDRLKWPLLSLSLPMIHSINQLFIHHLHKNLFQTKHISQATQKRLALTLLDLPARGVLLPLLQRSLLKRN